MVIDACEINEKINNYPEAHSTYSKETLFHKNHRTGGTNDDWKILFDENLKDRIHKDFEWWFKDCNYPLL